MGFRTDQVDEALISLALAGPARVVAGRFRLEHEAGSGGMGTVYRAVDLVSGPCATWPQVRVRKTATGQE